MKSFILLIGFLMGLYALAQSPGQSPGQSAELPAPAGTNGAGNATNPDTSTVPPAPTAGANPGSPAGGLPPGSNPPNGADTGANYNSPPPEMGIPQNFNPGNEAFIYDPTGKRDPFDPSMRTDTPAATPTLPEASSDFGAEVDKSTRPLEPLETFDLAQLRLEAVIWQTANPRAMIRDPQGGVHYVKMKSRIGKKDGFVVAIREGEIVIVEYSPDNNGQFIKSFKVLELR